MFFEAAIFALRGSISRASAWAPVGGAAMLWLALYMAGYTIALPSTWGQSIFVFLACLFSAWLLIVIGKFLYYPYYALENARAQITKLSPDTVLSISFDPDDSRCIRYGRGLQGNTGERFYLLVTNNGNKTLNDVSVRALPSIFTECGIAVCHQMHTAPEGSTVVIFERDELHPWATDTTFVFGMSYHSETSNADDVFGNVQHFTIEARARDAKTVQMNFEFNISHRPMIRVIE